jgi:hypothetical protein
MTRLWRDGRRAALPIGLAAPWTVVAYLAWGLAGGLADSTKLELTRTRQAVETLTATVGDGQVGVRALVEAARAESEKAGRLAAHAIDQVGAVRACVARRHSRTCPNLELEVAR